MNETMMAIKHLFKEVFDDMTPQEYMMKPELHKMFTMLGIYKEMK